MKLICLISWFEEPLKGLERAIVDSHGAGVTHVVALDGAYAALPGGRARSAPSQAKHIRKVCHHLRIPCVVEARDTSWQGNEIEKRTALFDLGYRAFQPTLDDWFFVMDADQTVEQPRDLKPWLAEQTDDTFTTLAYEHDDTRFTDDTRRRFVRSLFRCVPGLHVTGNHYTYKDATGRTLWGRDEIPATNAPLVIHNHSRSRGGQRLRSREDYYQRHQREVEASSEPEGCTECGQPWRLRTPVGFALEQLPDGTTQLVSNSTAFLCDRHGRRAIHHNRMAAQRIAGSDERALAYVLRCMRDATTLKPPVGA